MLNKNVENKHYKKIVDYREPKLVLLTAKLSINKNYQGLPMVTRPSGNALSVNFIDNRVESSVITKDLAVSVFIDGQAVGKEAQSTTIFFEFTYG